MTPGSIGPYRVERVIGTGGWSTVYMVRDADGAPWALKRLRDDLGPEAVARFHREVESLRRIDHPGVVRLVDAGIADGAPYLVTPVVAGPTLRSALAAGPLLPELAVAVVHAAARAVAAIHAAGLVHRDLKPDNLVLDGSGAVIVIDLGLALGPEHSRHTAAEALTGSVPYLAPEQIDDRLPSPASDVWALGVVLFEAIAGRRPFQRARGSEEIAAILAGRAPRLDEQAPAADDALAALVARCLDPSPAARPGDAAALAVALAPLVDPSVSLARWMAAPAAEARALAERRAGALAAAAAKAHAAGDRFAATRLLERGLAYRPDDPELAALVERVLGGRGQAQTIRGAAPAPTSSAPRVGASTPTAPTGALAPAPPRGRRRWWIAAALAVALGTGLAVTRPWSSRAAEAPAVDAPAAGDAAQVPAGSSTAPTTGESRPAHVRPSRPAGAPR